MAEKEAQCKRCKEKISIGASVCKTCGQEQNGIVYWIKQIGTPIGLLATVISVSISAVAFIRASQVPIPEARLAITNWKLTHEGHVLRAEILNFGTAPATIKNFLINHSITYYSGGGERYSGTMTVRPHESIAAGAYRTIEMDASQFTSRSTWQGSLHHRKLPVNVRVPFPNEKSGQFFGYSYTSSCNITLVTSGVNGRDDWSNSFENVGSICTAVEHYAIKYFSNHNAFSRE